LPFLSLPSPTSSLNPFAHSLTYLPRPLPQPIPR
jgi:hypothetical protein